MKKILLAFDGTHFSEGAFEFARLMNEKQPILLTGIFVPQVVYSQLWSYADPSGSPVLFPLVEEEDNDVIKKNIKKFEDRCILNNIDYRVHEDSFNFALPELKKETRFADLIILGSETFYENIGKHQPNEYLKDVIHTAECPVIVVPEHFDFPKTNVLAFDGSESSVYAIKQFAYLFPELCQNKTLLVYSKDDNEESLPDEEYMEELAPRHFTNLTFLKLKMDPKNNFVTWLGEKKSSILVCGALGRSYVSQLFKKSFLSEVISEHKFPVFITHR